MQYMLIIAYTAYFTYYVYILCRTMLSWKPCDFIGPTKTRVTLFCTRHSLSGTHNTRVICASRHGHLCQRNCKRPIAKTWCLSARLGSLTVHFSSGWITSGSANSCSCSKSIQWQTQACSTKIAPMFLCWKSTMATGNQVTFCIFCILNIFWFIICRPQPGWISVNLQ